MNVKPRITTATHQAFLSLCFVLRGGITRATQTTSDLSSHTPMKKILNTARRSTLTLHVRSPRSPPPCRRCWAHRPARIRDSPASYRRPKSTSARPRRGSDQSRRWRGESSRNPTPPCWLFSPSRPLGSGSLFCCLHSFSFVNWETRSSTCFRI